MAIALISVRGVFHTLKRQGCRKTKLIYSNCQDLECELCWDKHLCFKLKQNFVFLSKWVCWNWSYVQRAVSLAKKMLFQGLRWPALWWCLRGGEEDWKGEMAEGLFCSLRSHPLQTSQRQLQWGWTTDELLIFGTRPERTESDWGSRGTSKCQQSCAEGGLLPLCQGIQEEHPFAAFCRYSS